MFFRLWTRAPRTTISSPRELARRAPEVVVWAGPSGNRPPAPKLSTSVSELKDGLSPVLNVRPPTALESQNLAPQTKRAQHGEFRAPKPKHTIICRGETMCKTKGRNSSQPLPCVRISRDKKSGERPAAIRLIQDARRPLRGSRWTDISKTEAVNPPVHQRHYVRDAATAMAWVSVSELLPVRHRDGHPIHPVHHDAPSQVGAPCPRRDSP